MLQNINSYGLSHLCAFSIFELDDESNGEQADVFRYPFLDIYFKYISNIGNLSEKLDVEFYFRGNKFYKTSFNNLFEYHIFTEQSGYRH